MKIAVFSDLHYCPGVSRSGMDPDHRFAAGLTHLDQCAVDVDLVVLCGDLTDKGDIASYQRLKSRLQTLANPYLPLIGNHDNRENFYSVFDLAPRDENGFCQQIIDHGPYRVIALDTLYAPPYEYLESHRGYLCEKRLAWLGNALREAGNRRCIIFMHHPPHDTGFKSMDSIALKNGDAFYEVIEKTGNVAHICCGHIHRTISGNHRGISYSVFKSPMMQMPLDFEGNNIHVEVDEPPAFGLITMLPEGVQVQTEDYPVG